MTRFAVFTLLTTYAGKVRTIRNEIRTERLLNSLPAHVRADIGWPDRNAERESSRH
ncbi:hypothetical protein [Mesorhizobium sp. SP-1A]|uniref:hypothetical protein n=1 Tax=Mesorhizobium sp. SP-1A TaxID=3077840 RepID=UPI0028F6C98A|nr:hypothetical protein [Mesorhizobium sp. SP-1A]